VRRGRGAENGESEEREGASVGVGAPVGVFCLLALLGWFGMLEA
jgi:hypothetical protein